LSVLDLNQCFTAGIANVQKEACKPMTITHLDFVELDSADEAKGYGLQNLVVAIGKRLGLRVEAGGRGADKGRDVFFTTHSEVVHGLHIPSKILVSCKDKTKSGRQLKVTDLDAFHLRVAEHGCNSFLLVTTIPPTDDCVTHVREIGRQHQFTASVWQPDDLKDILLNGQNDIFRFTIARFFPKSSRVGDSNQHSFDFFAESLLRMDKEDSLELSLEFIDGVEDLLLVWENLEKVMTRKDVDVQTDLQKHFCKALSLKNDELSDAISEAAPLQESLAEWASEELEWEELELHKSSLKGDNLIELEVIASKPYYRMGESFNSGITAVIHWDEDGFSVHEAVDDWEDAERLDAE
jgi:hypothetical protein